MRAVAHAVFPRECKPSRRKTRQPSLAQALPPAARRPLFVSTPLQTLVSSLLHSKPIFSARLG